MIMARKKVRMPALIAYRLIFARWLPRASDGRITMPPKARWCVLGLEFQGSPANSKSGL